MKVSPKSLLNEFNDLFDKQDEIEKDRKINEKKRKYEHLELESRYNTNTLSEIFQDPDLLARISKDAYIIMNKSFQRICRVRDAPDIIVSRKPQAKDVLTSRVIEEDIATMYDHLEKSLDGEQEYINPLVPKMRRYIAYKGNGETSTSQPQQTTPPIPNSIDTSVAELQEQEDNAARKGELDRMLDETSKLISTSPLKTVHSNHLYTLLPRLTEINAFIYVKEDYNTPKSKDDRNTMDNTLVTFTIFNPNNPHAKFQEIEILGTQTLSDLRDAMYCQSDFTLNRNHKNQDPKEKILNTTKTKKSPSVIYIDHVFYVDTRSKDDIPPDYYNKWIDTWLKKKQVNRDVYRYEQKNMQTTVLQDISFELHKPIAFIHMDDCEHMMLVDDVSLISNNESGMQNAFPRTTRNLRYDRFKCSMCSVYPATKTTHEDIVSGFSPCYFCDICFQSFHPNNTNVKVTEYNGTPGRELKSKMSLSKRHKPKKQLTLSRSS